MFEENWGTVSPLRYLENDCGDMGIVAHGKYQYTITDNNITKSDIEDTVHSSLVTKFQECFIDGNYNSYNKILDDNAVLAQCVKENTSVAGVTIDNVSIEKISIAVSYEDKYQSCKSKEVVEENPIDNNETSGNDKPGINYMYIGIFIIALVVIVALFLFFKNKNKLFN